MHDYHNMIGLILIFVVIVSVIAVTRRAPKIDEGNSDIYGKDYFCTDDDRSQK